MSIGLGVTRTEYSANNLDFNQAAGTALFTIYAAKPMRVQRFGVISEAAQGLLAAMRLRLRRGTGGGGTVADIADTTLNPGGARARGVPVYKDMEDRIFINAGETLIVAVQVDAGGTSTGRAWIEFEEAPFNGANIPAAAIKSA